jgi:hypothetical protein
MARLSEKYIAGFLDADGWISINFAIGSDHKTRKRFQINIGFSQKESQNRVLYLIQKSIGGIIRTDEVKGQLYSKLTLQGHTARDVLNRIKKHLVIKRHYANVCLDLVSREVDDIEEAKRYLKEQRKIKSLPMPNFPPRKWLAGYVDGDGCFLVRRIQGKYSGIATIHLNIAASNQDTEGIEIIQKNFGGRFTRYNDNVTFYGIDLPPSKAKEMLGYFSKHLITKREQAELILRCAEMGHYRDGINIKSALSHLKTQPHRLNESGDSVDKTMEGIKDIPKRWSWHYDKCIRCGTIEIPHRSKGYCQNCYTRPLALSNAS